MILFYKWKQLKINFCCSPIIAEQKPKISLSLSRTVCFFSFLSSAFDSGCLDSLNYVEPFVSAVCFVLFWWWSEFGLDRRRTAACFPQRWIVGVMKPGRRHCLWESRGRDSLLLWLPYWLSLFPHLHLLEKEYGPSEIHQLPHRRPHRRRSTPSLKVCESVLVKTCLEWS